MQPSEVFELRVLQSQEVMSSSLSLCLSLFLARIMVQAFSKVEGGGRDIINRQLLN